MRAWSGIFQFCFTLLDTAAG